MKTKFFIITILSYQIAHSQNLQDTTYFKNFEIFIHFTEKLIKESHKGNDSTTNGKSMRSKRDSIEVYANQVQNSLKRLDSIDRFSLSMGNFFVKGKWPKSQDISSPIAQLQCSYLYYIEALRKAGDNTQEIVNASLILENYLQKGFPSSKYCPFFYAPVEVNFEKTPAKKIVLPDSIRNNQ